MTLSRANSLTERRDALLRHGAKEEDIDIAKVPGSFEIPLIAKKLASKGTYNAVICLGTDKSGAQPLT